MKTSVNLRIVERIELHRTRIRFYFSAVASRGTEIYIYQQCDTHDEAEKTYKKLIARVGELR